jgi:hypothetical protein
MRPEESFECAPPSPLELAAYLDGELEGSRSEAVEAWLTAHPDRRAEMNALRRVMRLYQETGPPEPAAPAWDTVLQQVHAAVAAPHVTPTPTRRRTGGPLRLALALATAAALMGFWLLARSWWLPADPFEDNDDEPYPVATADEITVISMETGDAGALVVGQPPVSDNYEFASPADVTGVKLEGAGEDKRPPEMLHGEVPMLFAPDIAASRRQD